VAENFTSEARSKVMGQQTAAQMIGCAIMVLISGYLAVIGWNYLFYVHLIAIIPLILVLLFLPHTKPSRKMNSGDSPVGKVKLTRSSYGWAVTIFIFFIAAQIAAVFIAFLVNAHNLGTAAQVGQAMLFFATGGFVMGTLYGRLSKATKNFTLATGFFLFAIGYAILAFAPNITLVYVGSFIGGFSSSIIMPCILVGTSQSVDSTSAPMALSITVCAQNLGQFLSIFIVTPIAQAVGSDVNTSAFIFGALLILTMGIGAVLWGVFRNIKCANVS
jgi:MFS family permease